VRKLTTTNNKNMPGGIDFQDTVYGPISDDIASLYRDGKPQYLADVPCFVHYVRKTGERYQELWLLVRLFNELKIGDAGVTGVTF